MTIYHTAYIGLGSNLGQPREHIQSALQALSKLPDSTELICSPWYGSKAIGPGTQADYINAVAAVKTHLTPASLLEQLQAIETEHGRQREIRWGARTLDLDLLLYDSVIMKTDTLELPHPEMTNRNFVLYPLSDLAPSLQLPNGEMLAALISRSSMDGLYRIDQQDDH